MNYATLDKSAVSTAFFEAEFALRTKFAKVKS